MYYVKNIIIWIIWIEAYKCTVEFICNDFFTFVFMLLISIQMPMFVTFNRNFIVCKIQKHTIFINKETFFNLILKSSIKFAEDFRSQVSKILDKIDNGEEIYKNTDVNSSETQFKQCDYIEEYTKNNSAYDVKDENTLYLGSLGIVTRVGNDTNVKLNCKKIA